jgi:HEAT repeat protein
VVRKAIEGLGNSKDPRAQEALTPLCGHADQEIRAAAEQALKQLPQR